MKLPLRHCIGCVALACLSLALTLLSPLVAISVLFGAIVGSYFWLDRSHWQHAVLFVFSGITAYILLFSLSLHCLAPPETALGVKGISLHRQWLAAKVPLQNGSAVPFGGLIGILLARMTRRLKVGNTIASSRLL